MPLPTFIIIGAPRCGTTTLYAYLERHPEVGMSVLKEPNYFAYDPSNPEEEEIEGWFSVRTRQEYEAQFAHATGKKAIGEASTVYLATPGVAARIGALLPGVKLVAVLRDPVDRAYSGYVKWLRETNRRLDPGTDFTPHAPWLQPDSHWVKTGYYARHLREYRERFGRERIRIYLYEDLVASVPALLEDLHAFIGVVPHRYPRLAAQNPGGLPRHRFVNAVLRNRGLRRRVRPWAPSWLAGLARRMAAADRKRPPALPAGIRTRLQDVYRESILDLQDLLQRDLGHWLPDGDGPFHDNS
jgi:hypothetical protein